jgi:uncharacterized peroxidase-related enzyme
MARFPIASEDDAEDEVVRVLVDFRTKMGFTEAPNFIKAQAASHDVMNGTWDLVQNVLIKGTLPRSLKEMIFVAISVDRGCSYCEAAHVACCRMLGVDEKTLTTLLKNIDELLPERSRDIVKFAVTCARSPQALDDADFDRMRAHGLSDAELTELIAMAGLAVYANTLADATQVEPDSMFFG